MRLISAYGFSVDADTKRVYLNDGKVVSFTQSIPTGIDGVTKGTDKGNVVGRTSKVGYNMELNLVYNDIKGKPYTGKVTIYSDLPHDEAGKLLVDSIGEIKEYKHGLAFTVNDAVAMDATQSLKSPKLNDVYPAKTSLVLDFDATEGEEAYFYTGYAVGGGKTFTAEVYDPDEDMVILGLTTGTAYECYVTATNTRSESSDPSNKITATCKSVIPAPVFKSCVSGDGFATVTYTDITPPEPWTIDHYAYSATNVDDKDAPAVEGHIEGGKIALPNDITWSVRICAVCNPGRVPGDFSDALTVTPEKKVAPFKPTITQAYAKDGGQIQVNWVKGTASNSSRQSGMTVDQWKVSFKSVDGKGTDFSQTTAGNVLELLSQKVNIGKWEITVSGHNDQGWGAASAPAGVEYKPTAQDPMIGGTSYDDGTYKYCIFYSNATTGYEAIRTEAGKSTTFEVLLIGAGGAGKGQTVTFGKGGDGGGGQLVYGELPPTYPGSIFVTVPNGGTSKGDSPANTTVKEGNTVLIAVAGKTATDKNNAEGFDRTKVAASWEKLNMFTWLMPGSQYVGGVAQAGEQNYPNATFAGQGGTGTKDSQPGKGGESYVAIRWKK
jgi:hypothetical protein